MKDIPIIRCPFCGTEYHPAEIYLPEAFFGKPEEIIKTPAGAIDFYVGSDMGLDEEYICDGCGKKLNIRATLVFEVEAVEDDFEEEYVSKFTKQPKVKLEEEDLFND